MRPPPPEARDDTRAGLSGRSVHVDVALDGRVEHALHARFLLGTKQLRAVLEVGPPGAGGRRVEGTGVVPGRRLDLLRAPLAGTPQLATLPARQSGELVGALHLARAPLPVQERDPVRRVLARALRVLRGEPR